VFLESLKITNFRCFGSAPQTIRFEEDITAFVGANGAGKTAVMLALLRLFGVTADQRRVRRQDFHVPFDETTAPASKDLNIEAVLSFPELTDGDPAAASTVPEFFQQMAADENGKLKCRLRLEATWTDDGSLEGVIEEKHFAIRNLAAEYKKEECSDLRPTDRSRVQVIYVPATRDGTSQVASFLKGRLWRAITWTEEVRETLKKSGNALNTAFEDEPGIDVIEEAVKRRWQQVCSGGTVTDARLRPIDLRFEEFVRKVEVIFVPDEAGRPRGIGELSDGQRSLFHIALTAATLDIEQKIIANEAGEGFQPGDIALPALTILAMEEPENNLAPFYLSRIIKQIQDVTGSYRAQAVVSSHSASIMARVEPDEVRHFRLESSTRTASVMEILLTPAAEDVGKYLREAVHAYPELYFARFVVLGEGASEEIVLPLIAEAKDFPIDRSFVAVVPLGGRHVNHLWKLLRQLNIPHATLLDLDRGRHGGGWGRISLACKQLIANGEDPAEVLNGDAVKEGVDNYLKKMAGWPAADKNLDSWVTFLRKYKIFFCAPLDLDMSMLESFADDYRKLEDGMKGPKEDGDATEAVLGEEGDAAYYDDDDWEDSFRWYRYLFLGRGKPTTHLRILTRIDAKRLSADAPEALVALVDLVKEEVLPDVDAAE
jgi:putative ATP-dependent endonuclease of the OLD family